MRDPQSKAENNIDRQFQYFYGIILTAVSAVALGALAGWLTGYGGWEPTVIAAAVPAILSIAGTVLFVKGLTSEDPRQGLLAALFVLLFCVSFYSGVARGYKGRTDDVILSAQKTLERHFDYVAECSQVEWFINEGRRGRNQPPLTFEQICGTSP